MEIAAVDEKEPCNWCLGDRTALLLCHCRLFCGELDCPYSEEFRMIPIETPRFLMELQSFVSPAPVQLPVEVVSMKPYQYGAAVARVADMHRRCGCKVCAQGITRATCTGCSDFWPCKTVHALRGNVSLAPTA